MEFALAAPLPQRRRLRGKQAVARRPQDDAMLRLLAFEELFCLMTSWLDQRALLRLAAAGEACLAAAASPEAWRGRVLELRSRQLRTSQQLLAMLRTLGGRWAFVHDAAMPQLQPSAAAARALCAALPALRALDLRPCPRAGGRRLLAELGARGGLERATLPGYLPSAELPQLKALELQGTSCELHVEGAEAWARLPGLCPRLEVLRAPWLEEEAEEELSEDMWEKLHQPPLGSATCDECLRHLRELPELRELDLSGAYELGDASLRTLGDLPKLERLVLQNMGSGISSEGLRSLADGCAPLRFLDLSLCKDTGRRPMSGRTALKPADVEAFRRRRPGVEVRFS